MADKVRPIKPSEVAGRKEGNIPDAVFESFNELISRTFVDGYATIKQDDVVALLKKKGLKKKDVFDNGWLNVEKAYEAAGWKVSYDQPAYNESYPATFTFSPKSRKD